MENSQRLVKLRQLQQAMEGTTPGKFAQALGRELGFNPAKSNEVGPLLPEEATVGDYSALIVKIKRDKYPTPHSIKEYLDNKGLQLNKK